MRQKEKERSGLVGLIVMLILAILVVILSKPLYNLLTGANRGTTYLSVQSGYGGDVTVSLMAEDGVILKLKAEGPMETPGIGGAALNTYNTGVFSDMEGMQIKEAPLEIDAVSGATLTSRAVKKGLENVLHQALEDLE